MAVSKNTLRDFKLRTHFDVAAYLSEYSSFYKNDYPKMVNYYDGNIVSIPQSVQLRFDTLYKKSLRLSNIMDNSENIFDSYDHWELMELCDEVKGQLQLFTQLGRLRRSSRYAALNDTGIIEEYTVQDFESPEKVAQRDREDYQNDWVTIYQNSGIREVDYKDGSGGYNVSLAKRNSEKVFLYGVVDYMIGERVYGKDMDMEFTYEDDDVKVLGYRDTTKQAVKVLSSTMRNDISSNLEVGLSPDLLVGNTYGMQSIIFITRELEELLSVDDTIVSVVITSVTRTGSTMMVEFECESYFNYMTKQTLEIR